MEQELFPDRLKNIAPSDKATEPALWVRRLSVYPDFELSDSIRDIVFRRGLNIVWAQSEPNPDPQLENVYFRGHFVGKTTMCRLIRYCLSREDYAPEEQRGKIQRKFETACVCLEAVVNGEPWAILKPLGPTRNFFARQTDDHKELLESKTAKDRFDIFLDSLQGTLLKNIPAKQLVQEGKTIEWGHLLQWLARDQECRFDNFIDWRSSKSQSGAPELSVVESHHLARSVLDLISDSDIKAQREVESLKDQVRKNEQRKAQLGLHTTRTLERLFKAVGLRKEEVVSGDFLKTHVENHVKDKIAECDAEIERIDQENGAAAIEEEIRNKIVWKRLIEQDIPEKETLKKQKEEELAGLESDDAATKKKTLDAMLSQTCPLFDTTIDAATAFGCPGPSEEDKSIPMKLEGQRRAIETLIKNTKKTIGELANQIKSAMAELKKTNKELESLDDRLESVKRSQKQKKDLVYQERGSWKHLITELDGYLKTEKEITDLDNEISSGQQKIKEATELRTTIKKKHKTNLHEFSKCFDYFLYKMTNPDSRGSAELFGNILNLIVHYGTSRDGVTIETFKSLGFDWASIIYSILGHGCHPRFLIHDCPREGDLQADIYDVLFKFVEHLESFYPANQSGFQYIMTTTTAPPGKFRSEPYCRLKLDGREQEGFFFKTMY